MSDCGNLFVDLSGLVANASSLPIVINAVFNLFLPPKDATATTEPTTTDEYCRTYDGLACIFPFILNVGYDLN